MRLDGIFARAKLSFKLNAGAPELSERGVRLRRARHPLLDKDKAVPIDVELGEDYDTLVITGPNTGGKTVTLKTIGLLCLMAQCGLHIPAAEGSCVPIFDKVLADIGDEQSIEQSLSTFSAHMVNIVNVLKRVRRRIASSLRRAWRGNRPRRGRGACRVDSGGCARGCVIAATTHYAELKVYATNTPGVMNASCEFDVDTLRPTYRLLLGIPGKSNAFAISRRLGLPEEIIEDAKGRVGMTSAKLEETIESSSRPARSSTAKRTESARQLRQAEEEAKKAAQLRAELEIRLEKSEQKARREAERILADARAVAESTFRELDAMRSAQNEENDHQRINAARAEMRRKLNETQDSLRKDEPAPEEKKIRARRAGGRRGADPLHGREGDGARHIVRPDAHLAGRHPARHGARGRGAASGKRKARRDRAHRAAAQRSGRAPFRLNSISAAWRPSRPSRSWSGTSIPRCSRAWRP